MQRQFFGVDIGNSGLRVAELHATDNTIGSMLRINWRHDDWQSENVVRNSPGGHAESEQRFLPSDAKWTELLEPIVNGDDRPKVLLVASVRRDASQVLSKFLHSHRLASKWKCRIVDASQLPLAVDVLEPSKVGIDRLLAAWAAAETSAQLPLVVVQAGSAVTVDLVVPGSQTHPYVFSGGAIVPGVPMMLRLLGKAADQLPQIDADDLIDLPNLPGKNTEQAMLCGAASALVGGVRHLVERYRKQLSSEVAVILSGGDGVRLSPFIEPPLRIESHLVHRGLLQLAKLIDCE